MKWKELRKIAVSGSRRFGETDLCTHYVDAYIRKNFDNTNDVVILTGGAVGVDGATEIMCLRRGYMNLVVHARWLELEPSGPGKNPAGVIRNQHIADLCNEAICFWDGSSAGTKDFIDRIKKSGKPYQVWDVRALRKELKIKPPVKFKVAPKVTGKKLGRIKRLMKAADMVGWLKEMKAASKKKRTLNWMKERS